MATLLSSNLSTEAHSERPHTSITTAADGMKPKSIYKETRKLYTPVHEAGKGTCGNVTFCVRTRSAATSSTTDPIAQRPALVAVKIPSRSMSRERIAYEIIALKRIHGSFAADNNNTIAKHFPTPIDYDPIKDGGSGWSAVNPIRGFDLERLRVVVTEMIQPSSQTDLPRRVPFPAIPEVLVLHVAKQLTEAVGWLHNVADMSHNDVFGGNVMLDVSESSNKGPSFTMPTVVLIDFDRASTKPNGVEKGADRLYVYELVYAFDSAGRVSSQDIDIFENAIVSKELMTWWGSFRSFLVINKSQCLQEESSCLTTFWERFGAGIGCRLEGMAQEEEQVVQELIDIVVEKEVRFPSEERIREVLGR